MKQFCVVPKLRLGMHPAKLRFAFPLPQPSPEQTQPPPQGGLAFPPEFQGNSFTLSPVVNTCFRNGSQSNRKRIPQTKNLLVPSLQSM